MVIYPDEDFDKSVLDIYNYKLPSHFVGKDVEEISEVIKEVGHKDGLKNRINNLKDGKGKDKLNKQYNTLDKYNKTLMGIREHIEIKRLEKPKEEGAVGGVEETRDRPMEIMIPKVLKTNIDEGLDIEDLRKHGFKPPLEYKEEELDGVIKNAGTRMYMIKSEVNKLDEDMINFAYISNTTSSAEKKKESLKEIKKREIQTEDLVKSYNNLNLLTDKLKEKKGKGVGLYKIKRNGQ